MTVSDLWDGELEGNDSGLKNARFENVALAAASARGDSDVAFAFEKHGCVQKDLGDARKILLEAFVKNEIEE